MGDSEPLCVELERNEDRVTKIEDLGLSYCRVITAARCVATGAIYLRIYSAIFKLVSYIITLHSLTFST